MNTPIFQIMLREYVRKAEEKYNFYAFMGWSKEWIAQYRHALLKALLKDQLKGFDK